MAATAKLAGNLGNINIGFQAAPGNFGLVFILFDKDDGNIRLIDG